MSECLHSASGSTISLSRRGGSLQATTRLPKLYKSRDQIAIYVIMLVQLGYPLDDLHFADLAQLLYCRGRGRGRGKEQCRGPVQPLAVDAQGLGLLVAGHYEQGRPGLLLRAARELPVQGAVVAERLRCQRRAVNGAANLWTNRASDA